MTGQEVSGFDGYVDEGSGWLAEAGQEAPSKSRGAWGRIYALDALRGLAILGMVLSGMVPYFRHTLPAWMYHAQSPPPDHRYQSALTGISWVDVVFPMFLFSLGAAVPLALWPKIQDGASRWRLAWGAVWRGFLLLFFALFEQHLTSGMLTGVYGTAGNLISMAAFVVLFWILVRFPASWPQWMKVPARLLGWAAAIGLLAVVRYPDESGFSIRRYDPILAILANVVVTTSLIWLVFPLRARPRIFVMGLIVAFYLAFALSPWEMGRVEILWLKSLLGERIYDATFWTFNPTYQYYLVITLMGTVAGDILLTWLRRVDAPLSFSIRHSRWRELSTLQCLALGVVTAALCAGVVVGLYLNDWIASCVFAAAVGSIGALLLYGAPARRRVRGNRLLRGQSHVPVLMFQQLFVWGAVCLATGLALWPFQGGIRKDPATLSYLFTTAGLSFMLLIFLAIITEAMHRPGSLFLLIANGQNPMIAYVAGGMVIVPLLNLIQVGGGMSLLTWLNVATPEPWPAFGRALGLTLLVAVFVFIFTRLRIFWRT